MIYVIRTDYYDRDTNTPFSVMKIGYCKDEAEGNRMSNYKTENPYRKVLYKIPGGTLKHETLLHKKFKHLWNTGNEWFIESNEIYEFFETANLNSLIELEKGGDTFNGGESIPDFLKPFKYLQIEIKEEDLTKFLDKKLNVLAETTVCAFNNTLDLSSKISSLKLLLNYNMIERDRIPKLFLDMEGILGEDLYTEGYSSEEILERLGKKIALSNSEEIRSNFYYRKELCIGGEDPDSNEILKANVNNYFRTGERYTNQRIKSLLQYLYNTLRIPKIATAKDIEKWFEVRTTKITNKETKKRDMGYELLKQK